MFATSRSTKLFLLGVSTALSVLVGVVFLAAHRRPSKRKLPDYALSFVDRQGKKISDADGPLKLMLDPFTVYRNLPNQKTDKFIIDRHGFRSACPERRAVGVSPPSESVAQQYPDGRTRRADAHRSPSKGTNFATSLNGPKPRIMLLGGSAAFGEQLPSDEATVAWQMGKLLGGHEVVNAGVVGYLSGQELALMVHHLDDHRPAAYVVLDGWNELFDQWLFNRREDDQFGFNNAFFMINQRLRAHHVRINGEGEAPAEPPSAAASPTENEDEYLARLHRRYCRNLEKMHAFARSRGAVLLVVFQPELGHKQTKTERETTALGWWERTYGYTSRGFPQRYTELISAAKGFCNQAGIACIDLNTAAELTKSPETLFYDVVHLNENGNALMARIISHRLAELLGSPPAASQGQLPKATAEKQSDDRRR